VIILGIVLLIIGVLAHLNILYTTGLILIVLGVILALLGTPGRAIGGLRHWY